MQKTKKALLSILLGAILLFSAVLALNLSAVSAKTTKNTETTYEKHCYADSRCFVYVYEDGVLTHVYEESD